MTDTKPATNAAELDAGLPPLTGFHHVGLTVRDVEASEAWYARVLGFQRVFVEPHNGGTGYCVVMIRPGTTLDIGLDHHDGNAGEAFGEQRTGLDHLSIAVERREDLDAWAAHLDRVGVAHGEIAQREYGQIACATLCFRDPDNIQLELIWAR